MVLKEQNFRAPRAKRMKTKTSVTFVTSMQTLLQIFMIDSFLHYLLELC